MIPAEVPAHEIADPGQCLQRFGYHAEDVPVVRQAFPHLDFEVHALAARVVLGSCVVHTDDTSVKVRDAWRKMKHTGRFWPYVGDPLHPLIVFDYTPTRERDGPAAFLKDYRGYLQADAFGGYDGIYAGSNGRIIEVGCWAHARRKYRVLPASLQNL